MREKFTLLLVSFFVIGCSKSKNIVSIPDENSKTFNDKYTLTEYDTVTFPLDSTTAFWHYSSSISKSRSDTTYFYSFINGFDQSIKSLSLNGDKIKSIPLNVKTESGLNLFSEVSTHIFNSPNDLLIYNSNSGTLFNIDSTGYVKTKYDIINYSKDKNTPFPEPSTINPSIKNGDNIYFSCGLISRTDYRNIGMILKYNLKTRKREFILPLPDTYNKAFWGSPFKYLPNLTLNSKDSTLVISYPISSIVYKADLNGNIIDDVSVGSKYFSEIKPMFNDINYADGKNRDYGNEDIFSFSNSDFAKIIFDEDKNLYYRFAFIRPDINEVKLGNKIPDFSIIITDENLKKIGESRFSGEIYDISMVAVTKHGIWLPRKDFYVEDHSKISFSLFKIQEL